MTTTLTATPELINLKFERWLLIEELHIIRERRDRKEITLKDVEIRLGHLYPHLSHLNKSIAALEGTTLSSPKPRTWKKFLLI